MKPLRAVVGLSSAISLLNSVPGTWAEQNGSLWARLRRAVGMGNDAAKMPPPYHLYGGPAPDEKEYSYPPYGYPPPPSSMESSTSSGYGEESSSAESSYWDSSTSAYFSETSATDAYGSSTSSGYPLPSSTTDTQFVYHIAIIRCLDANFQYLVRLYIFVVIYIANERNDSHQFVYAKNFYEKRVTDFRGYRQRQLNPAFLALGHSPSIRPRHLRDPSPGHQAPSASLSANYFLAGRFLGNSKLRFDTGPQYRIVVLGWARNWGELWIDRLSSWPIVVSSDTFPNHQFYIPQHHPGTEFWCFWVATDVCSFFRGNKQYGFYFNPFRFRDTSRIILRFSNPARHHDADYKLAQHDLRAPYQQFANGIHLPTIPSDKLQLCVAKLRRFYGSIPELKRWRAGDEYGFPVIRCAHKLLHAPELFCISHDPANKRNKLNEC
ncbi:hypothetical protein B0T25DRAFT_562640 [Lasiosphaeria hispida]|uniref:Uncharacterized protein n=1 Tax=Lasiosphaeria hispida TaxID=260671 RepID=A0AAJ0HVS8_9PEZI|nr:hypothetical protein B0T25DRAFT_562640 [Lasiosphaeria hispida]